MALDLLFPNPASSSATEIFGMVENGWLTEDIEAQRAGMIDYLDVLNYMNGNSFDDRAQTRHAIAYMALAMPSIAFIDPHKTREMGYNLGLVVDNLECVRLRSRVDAYNADHVTLVEHCLAAMLYRLVTGRPDHDADARALAQRVYDVCHENAAVQHVGALDTVRGRFDVVPNIMALMALELGDRFYGTSYAPVADGARQLIAETLRDKETGLFYESLQTGRIGYTGESVNPTAAWCTSDLTASANALDIAFAHYVDADGCERAWASFKERFMDELLAIDAEDLAASVGCSYITQLGPVAEALLGAMLAAKEMEDVATFGTLQDHLFEIADPQLWEGHMTYAALGDLAHMIESFSLFARVHVPWKKILSHDWESYYSFDYREVR